jgi:hypothetical protein
MLAAAVLVVLAGMLAILLLVGNRVQDHVDAQVRRIDDQIEQIRRDVNQRLPPAGAVPTATPFPTPTPAPSAAPTPTPTPTATATATPAATNTPAGDTGSTTAPNRTGTQP